ncbi:alpha/beta hydrolase [uncultured Algibacter sp.]|uniref:alpha/beta hydrolase family protein n=1 Tax=uncultured Algibacter sp. TaxID=298659 RepID=UPI0032174BBA
MQKLILKIIFLSVLITISTTAQNSPRPQDPKTPFNYISEDVFFTNKDADNIKLAGTLTRPKNKKKPAVVILISGSGPQNRNGEIKAFNHRPFLVISDYLTNHGIAVLRYDDRGTAKSEGQFAQATSKDFATDVEAAMTYLKTRNDINTSKIGLIGHSEGGLIAPMIATNNKDVAFMVLLAAPGVDGAKVLETQSRRAAELANTNMGLIDENEKLTKIIYGVIKNNTNIDRIKTKITDSLNDYKVKNPMSMLSPVITPVFINQQLKILKSKWLLHFIKTDPKDFLSKTTCPVLALNGSKDFQVVSTINLEGIKNALELAKNKDVTITEINDLNHLFQTAKTGSLQEYATIEETFSPLALKLISLWINKRF